MEQEIWKDIPGFEGYYQVSNMQRAKALERIITLTKKGKTFTQVNKEKLITPYNSGRYLSIGMWIGRARKIDLHRAMALAFIPNPENKPFVNHKDGDKLNNALSNLEWSTAKENTQHAIVTGLANPHCTKNKKKIKVFKDGALLGEYEGIKEWAANNGLPLDQVSRAINGRKNYLKSYTFQKVAS